MSDPVQDAIAAAEAEHADPNNAGAAGDDNKDKGGAAGAADDDKNKGGQGDGAGSGDGDGNGEQLDLAEVLEVEPADLTDDQKAFLAENRDDLTGKQVKALKEAGIDLETDDDKPVKAKPTKFSTEGNKSEVPADDSDLFVEIEDAEGKSYKITKISDIPESFMYKDSRQPLEVLDAINDLKQKKADREKARTQNAEVEGSDKNREQVANLWNDEIAELQADGTLPEGEIDWQKGEYGNGRIKKATDDLWTFMAEENSRREAKGLPFVVSLHDVVALKAIADAKANKDKGGGKDKDGKTQAELDAEAKAAKVKAEKARKIAGGQGSNGNVDADDKPTYVKGSGQSIADITEGMINELG